VTEVSPRTGKLLGGYIGLTAAVMTGFCLLIAGSKDGLLAGAVSAVLPDSLVEPGILLAEHYIDTHLMAVLTLMVTVIVAVLPALVFWLKEKLSASYELDGDHRIVHPELSLGRQVWDEAVMLVLVLAPALLAFRMSVTPGMELLGNALGQVVLIGTAAVDFIGPTLLRRGRSPVNVCRVLFFRYPLHSLFFGAVFALLTTAVAWASSKESPMAGILFMVTAYSVIFGAAVMLGTVTAANMKDVGNDIPLAPRAIIIAAMAGLLVFNGVFFGTIAEATWNVSAVLKCKWEMVPGTMKFERPTLKDRALKVSFDVAVTNPTTRKVQVDAGSTVTLFHKDEVVGETNIPPVHISAGRSVAQRIHFRVTPRKGIAMKALRMAKTGRKKGWLKTAKAAAKSAVDRTAYRATLRLPTPTGVFTKDLYRPKKEL
jgi:hypothetical protein